MGEISSIGRAVLLLGLSVSALGLLMWRFPKLFQRIGRLPGDVAFENGSVSVYVPITSCILASALLTALWLLASKVLK